MYLFILSEARASILSICSYYGMKKAQGHVGRWPTTKSKLVVVQECEFIKEFGESGKNGMFEIL